MGAQSGNECTFWYPSNAQSAASDSATQTSKTSFEPASRVAPRARSLARTVNELSSPLNTKAIHKRVSVTMTADQDPWQTLGELIRFACPEIVHEGRRYELDLTTMPMVPIRCGESLRGQTDLVLDRSSRWSEYYRCAAHSVMNSGVAMVNNSQTNDNLDKHSACDVLMRAMHPSDRHPTTVLLPEFQPYTEEQAADEQWALEQKLIIEHTRHGADPARRVVDMDGVRAQMARARRARARFKAARAKVLVPGNYLKAVVERDFGGRFPLYLKKAFGGGGTDVYKVHSLEELYARYDETNGSAFHLQEAVLDHDQFIRCMVIGSQLLPIHYRPEAPLPDRYDEIRPIVSGPPFDRLRSYALFVNAYHRWTFNSFEAFLKADSVQPIDYANACPDSTFLSLHVHFPWLLCALVRWLAFCVILDVDLRVDLEQQRYRSVLDDPSMPQLRKYEICAQRSREYFQIERFRAFCEASLPDLDDAMIRFYDESIDRIIARAIADSGFAPHERGTFTDLYKRRMETHFRPNAKDYLATPP